MDDYEFMDDDDYNREYIRAMEGLIKDLPIDEQELVSDELKQTRYNPTGNAAQDAHYNFLRAEKKAKKKNKVHNPHIKSYAQFMQSEEGLSDAEIKRRVREAMKGEQ